MNKCLRNGFILLTGVTLALASGVASAATTPDAAQNAPINIQETFDPLGPTVHAMQLDNGRTVHYIDEGKPGWETVLFLSGAGTTVREFGLTEFLRSLRQDLQLRFISVGRNGFGQTQFDPNLGFADYSKAVLDVLDRLGVNKFAIVAISGGGPYAAHIAARVPQRITSIHLAAALPPYGPKSDSCSVSKDQLADKLASIVHNPMVWWGGVANSPVHKIPGWVDAAYEEGARSFFIRGQMGDPSPLVHEMKLYCQRPGPDLSAVHAPAYLYWGADDTTVPTSAITQWKQALPHVAAVRVYAGIGHSVQYRHWGQILVDLAGRSDQILLCQDDTSQLVAQQQAQQALDQGATLGICAWTDAAATGQQATHTEGSIRDFDLN